MKNMKHKIGFIFLIISLILPNFSGCTYKNASVSDYEYLFDTIIKIQLFGTKDESILEGCFSIARECEELFSNTKENSDISKINNHVGEYVEVDEKTIELLQTAISYGDSSSGQFDITIGRLTDLWNISEISKNVNNDDNSVDNVNIPSSSQIQEIVKAIDYNKIIIQDNKVMLTDSNCKIDVGGIAKGYTADLIKEYIQEQRISSACIDLGGNILTVGSKPNGQDYYIGIQKPFAKQNETSAVLSISDKSVVSSGIYERYFKCDGQIYHHILDCGTGYPVQNSLYEVTIISDYSVDGDALSTITFMKGLEDGIKFIESIEHVEAIFITSDYEIHYTSGAKTYLKQKNR